MRLSPRAGEPPPSCTAGSRIRGATRRTARSCGSSVAGCERPVSPRWVRVAGRRVRVVPPARALSFEFVRRPENRSDEGTRQMAIVNPVPELCAALKLVSELLEMTRGSSGTVLSDWPARAGASGNRPVRSFAEALGADPAAVQAALSTPWIIVVSRVGAGEVQASRTAQIACL